jgi:hypothetical protein
MSPIAMREAWDELLWLGLHGKTMQTGAYSSLGMNCHASFMPREENQMPDFKFPDGVREIRNVMGWILLCRPGRRIHVTRIPQEKKVLSGFRRKYTYRFTPPRCVVPYLSNSVRSESPNCFVILSCRQIYTSRKLHCN